MSAYIPTASIALSKMGIDWVGSSQAAHNSWQRAFITRLAIAALTVFTASDASLHLALATTKLPFAAIKLGIDCLTANPIMEAVGFQEIGRHLYKVIQCIRILVLEMGWLLIQPENAAELYARRGVYQKPPASIKERLWLQLSIQTARLNRSFRYLADRPYLVGALGLVISGGFVYRYGLPLPPLSPWSAASASVTQDISLSTLGQTITAQHHEGMTPAVIGFVSLSFIALRIGLIFRPKGAPIQVGQPKQRINQDDRAEEPVSLSATNGLLQQLNQAIAEVGSKEISTEQLERVVSIAKGLFFSVMDLYSTKVPTSDGLHEVRQTVEKFFSEAKSRSPDPSEVQFDQNIPEPPPTDTGPPPPYRQSTPSLSSRSMGQAPPIRLDLDELRNGRGMLRRRSMGLSPATAPKAHSLRSLGSSSRGQDLPVLRGGLRRRSNIFKPIDTSVISGSAQPPRGIQQGGNTETPKQSVVESPGSLLDLVKERLPVLRSRVGPVEQEDGDWSD